MNYHSNMTAEFILTSLKNSPIQTFITKWGNISKVPVKTKGIPKEYLYLCK